MSELTMITDRHNYDNGYIGLVELQLGKLPDKVTVNGYELIKKSEFHISLLCAKRAATIVGEENAAQIQEEMVEIFQNFVKNKNPLTDYSLTGELRLMQRDERKTLVAMASVPGLEDLFKSLEEKYSVRLPLQPTHITMYTLQPEVGIGIFSNQDLAADSELVKLPEVSELLQSSYA